MSFENVVYYGSNGEKEGFASAVSLTDSGYLVEMKIPVDRTLQEKDVIGFEAQINDSNERGERISIAKFNDSTDNSWQSTQYWGVLTTSAKQGEETPDPTPTETPDPTPTETPDPNPTETPDPTPTDTPKPTLPGTAEPVPTDTPKPGTSQTPGSTQNGGQKTDKLSDAAENPTDTKKTSSPRTGDQTQAAVYVFLVLVALSGITVLTVKKR